MAYYDSHHKDFYTIYFFSKILDYVIIAQQADSLSTSDYQFGFKSHSSTMLCSTMLIETIQYYDENGIQAV